MWKNGIFFLRSFDNDVRTAENCIIAVPRTRSPFNELCTGRRETTTFVARLPVMINGKKFSRKLRFSNFSADQSSLPFDKTCCTRSFIYIYMRTHKYTCNIYKLAFAIHNTFCVRNRTHLTFYCHCSRRKIFLKKKKENVIDISNKHARAYQNVHFRNQCHGVLLRRGVIACVLV